MKKVFLTGNIILFVCMGVLCVTYAFVGGTVMKAVTGSVFLLQGVWNLIFALLTKKERPFAVILFVGLGLCLAGDVILNFSFIPGALLFGLGHTAYFAAWLKKGKCCLLDFLVSGGIFLVAAALIVFYPAFSFGGSVMMAVCLVYALVLSLMAGKAIANAVKKASAGNLVILVGSVLFALSDIALLFYLFAGANPTANTICLFTYFPAQSLLAFSAYLVSSQKKDENA